ncbi:MAG: DUF4230 domain-containing protein [Candidatus Latescibacterota bacterium]
MESILAILVVILMALVMVLVFRLRKKAPSARETSLLSSLESVRTIGHLSVFKAFTKEIVTETDHSWGAFGKKYLSWVLSKKKMAMIFEFEIDFRYDLRSSEFAISERSAGCYMFTMPPCMHEAHIRNIQFYDEQGARLFPWLLPDLLNGFLPSGFSEEDKNRLVAAARSHAEQQAKRLIETLETDVQASAERTLESITHSLGVKKVDFEFVQAAEPKLKVEFMEENAAA